MINLFKKKIHDCKINLDNETIIFKGTKNQLKKIKRVVYYYDKQGNKIIQIEL